MSRLLRKLKGGEWTRDEIILEGKQSPVHWWWNLSEMHQTRNSVCTCLDLILLET